MLVLVGTIPIDGLPLKHGSCKYEVGKLTIGDHVFEEKYVTLGTTAMVSAASTTCQALGIEEPHAVVIGDIGMGEGTMKMFKFLNDEVGNMKPDVLSLHYILPSRDPFINLVDTVNKLEKKPCFIADAGALLNAKAVKLSQKFDLFTPDPGEISFLADEDAAHPAYVQHFIFDVDQTEIPRLSKEAFQHGDTPRHLLIKAAVDHIVVDGEVVAIIEEPLIPPMEAMGGTGDTITGIVSALIHSGLGIPDACAKAAKINRIAGELANPTPATPIAQFIPYISEAVKKVMAE